MPGGRATGIATLHGLFTTSRLTIAGAAEGTRPGGVPDEARLARTVLQTVGPPGRPSLPQAEDLYYGQALCPGLRGAQPLLVLDGCEHLLRDCASALRRLLRLSPRPVRRASRGRRLARQEIRG